MGCKEDAQEALKEGVVAGVNGVLSKRFFQLCKAGDKTNKVDKVFEKFK